MKVLFKNQLKIEFELTHKNQITKETGRE